MRATLTFMSQAIRSWRSFGTLIPSSPALAKVMATQVGTLPPGAVLVELGAGTGVLTRELLRRFPGHPLVAVEFNPVLVARLRQDLPSVIVVEGCASCLRDHLAAQGIAPERVAAIISALPLLTLPSALETAILDELSRILPPGGRFIQLTYSRYAWRRRRMSGFVDGPYRRVWLNLPPATVMTFVRRDAPAESRSVPA